MALGLERFFDHLFNQGWLHDGLAELCKILPDRFSAATLSYTMVFTT